MCPQLFEELSPHFLTSLLRLSSGWWPLDNEQELLGLGKERIRLVVKCVLLTPVQCHSCYNICMLHVHDLIDNVHYNAQFHLQKMLCYLLHM